MIEAFKTEGQFPSSLPGHYFDGPIECYYRPRRLWTMLVILISSSLTLPAVFGLFYSLFTSGPLFIFVAVSLVGLGKTICFHLPDLLMISNSYFFCFLLCSGIGIAQVDGS